MKTFVIEDGISVFEMRTDGGRYNYKLPWNIANAVSGKGDTAEEAGADLAARLRSLADKIEAKSNPDAKQVHLAPGATLSTPVDRWRRR